MRTRREKVLAKYGLPDEGHSLSALARVSGYSQATLQEVYNRGIGAYKNNPQSVRLKGSFKKDPSAPLSAKLPKEQWAMARVYSFLDGNPKHDNDLRRKNNPTLSRDMPYRLVKTTSGYFVENKDTGKRYSADAMTKQKAEAQLRVLMAAASREKSSKGDYFRA